jgi:SAM-dependent methyltransferase
MPIDSLMSKNRFFMKEQLRSIVQRLLPVTARRSIVRHTCWPPVGRVRFGSLRRLKPISSEWGSERGLPIDRYYIEKFLAKNAEDIQGHILEVGTNKYTLSFGGERVIKSDVLHVAEEKPEVTIIGDLTKAEHIASNFFDCIILTQTLQVIYEFHEAVKTIFRILKPGGVVLVSVPGISKISRYDMDRWGYYWGFTSLSIQRLFEAVFPAANIHTKAFGNVLVTIAFLQGLATEELRKKELEFVDPDYELLITLRAVKPQIKT